jgi:hypothetical protein
MEQNTPARKRTEEVIWTSNPHWAAMLGWYFKWVGLGTACFIATIIGTANISNIPAYTPVVMFALGIALPLWVGHLLRHHIKYKITTQRVYGNSGWKTGHQEATRISRIEDVLVDQTMFQKWILGAIFRIHLGTVNFDTAGEHGGRQDGRFGGNDSKGDMFVWWGVKDPYKVAGIVNDIMSGDYEANRHDEDNED